MKSWEEAAQRWLKEKKRKKTINEDRQKLEWLAPYFAHRPLSDIDADRIVTVAEVKAVEASPSTANRYLSLIRSILRRACLRWEWVPRVPVIELYPEPKRRVRWLTRRQVVKLFQELPEHQRPVVAFALATGLRQANVVRIEWSQVDLPRRRAWIHGDQAKGQLPIAVPLNQVAVQVLEEAEGKHPRRVFTYRGRPFNAANTRAWRRALARAGIEDFRWHDLRHTWASWHAQEGTPLYVLQELGAWRSEAMVKRYAHLAPHQFAEHAETVSQLLLPLPDLGGSSDF